MQLPQIDDYQRLFLDDIPLLDVRAPIEFVHGAFPSASNLPLIDDEERHAIGIRYAQAGQDQAIALGNELVQGELKDQRIADWAEFMKDNPHGALYCFRGGMRSKISQEWIYQATGIAYPRVTGGYKALRRFLLTELDNAADILQAVLIGGRTGSGKTLLLQNIQHKIDLEGIYQHRGSSFGKRVNPQPSQVDIENALAVALLKHRNENVNKLLFEDEAANIGSRGIPTGIFYAMQKAPIILLEADLKQRVKNIFAEYIDLSLAEYQTTYGEEQGFEIWAVNLLSSLDRIQRRLGDKRHREIKMIMQDAILQQHNDNQREHHKAWIQILLRDYYDPMYDYQLGKKLERIQFRGTSDSIFEYLKTQYGIY